MPRKRPKSNRGPGRPYSGLPFWLRIAFAYWVEQTVEKYRQAGHRAPYLATAHEYLELVKGPDVLRKTIRSERELTRYLKSFKKKRLKAKYDYQILREVKKRLGPSRWSQFVAYMHREIDRELQRRGAKPLRALPDAASGH